MLNQSPRTRYEDTRKRHGRRRPWRSLFGYLVLSVALVVSLVAFGRGALGQWSGPWDTESLFRPPDAQWEAQQDGYREVYYEGEPYQGKPSRVYAVYAQPPGEGPFPGVVCVHGGGGTAFPDWVRLWADQGYAALAMDLAGCGPDGERLSDGGPDQSDTTKFAPFDENSADQMWTYHAVAAVIGGHSLLCSLPQVDAERTAVTGISWGGYLTCIVAGVDHRFQAAVPVYGCGFLHENSCWQPRLAAWPDQRRHRWVQYFDPSQYLPGVRCPILFLNGTNDFAYPLDSYRKSYDLVPGEKSIRIEVRMKHSHPDGWAPKEIALFLDSVLRDGKPLPQLGEIGKEGIRITVPVTAEVDLAAAHLNYTTDSGTWQERHWETVDARLGEGAVSAELPRPAPTAYYLDVIDARGAMVSTPPVIVSP